MELNRQRTVFGLALPPCSAGRKSGSPQPRHNPDPPDPPPPSCSPSGQPLAPQPASGTPQHRRAHRGVRSEPWLQQHPRHRSRSPQLLCSARHTRSNPPPCSFTFAETPWSWKTLQPWRSSPRPKGSGVRSSACDWNDRKGLKPSPERTENLTYKESFGIGVKLPQCFL